MTVSPESSGNNHTLSKEVLDNRFQSLKSLFSFISGLWKEKIGVEGVIFKWGAKSKGSYFLQIEKCQRLNFITHWLRLCVH